MSPTIIDKIKAAAAENGVYFPLLMGAVKSCAQASFIGEELNHQQVSFEIHKNFIEAINALAEDKFPDSQMHRTEAKLVALAEIGKFKNIAPDLKLSEIVMKYYQNLVDDVRYWMLNLCEYNYDLKQRDQLN